MRKSGSPHSPPSDPIVFASHPSHPIMFANLHIIEDARMELKKKTESRTVCKGYQTWFGASPRMQRQNILLNFEVIPLSTKINK